MPTVSALINTYNHERFIEQALVSVLEQDFPTSDLEIIVVDDGSTDRTAEIIRKFEPRVRSIRKPNGGQVSAFNVGVAEARGEIIAFLDGDDWWAKDKIRRVTDALGQNPSIAAVGHGYYEVNQQNEIRARWVPKAGARLTLETPALALQSTSLRIFLGTSRLTLRRLALARALPVPLGLPFFDNFIFSQAIAMGGALLLSELLCYYRVHSASLYASNCPTQQQLRTRYNLLCGLRESLPPRLKNIGVSDEAISAFLDFDRTDAARLKLTLEGGWPWETFGVESASFRQEYRNPDWGYRLFKGFVLVLTLLVPPRTFYRIRRWYSEHNLWQVREKLGKASLTVPHVVGDAVHKAADR